MVDEERRHSRGNGYVGDLQTGSTELIMMTSHVAQVFLTDREWADALAQMHRVLRVDGRIAFDMRNPLARGWEAWNPVDSLTAFSGDDGATEVWHEVTRVDDGLVTFDTTERVVETGAIVTVTSTLRFRDEETLRRSLSAAGFSVETLHGDWDGSAATPDSAELIVVAHRIPAWPES